MSVKILNAHNCHSYVLLLIVIQIYSNNMQRGRTYKQFIVAFTWFTCRKALRDTSLFDSRDSKKRILVSSQILTIINLSSKQWETFKVVEWEFEPKQSGSKAHILYTFFFFFLVTLAFQTPTVFNILINLWNPNV